MRSFARTRRLHITDEDPVAAVRTLARFVWDWYYQHPEFIRLVNSENLHEARHLKKSAQLHQLVNPVVDVLADIIKRGQKQGLFRDDIDVPQFYPDHLGARLLRAVESLHDQCRDRPRRGLGGGARALCRSAYQDAAVVPEALKLAPASANKKTPAKLAGV
jgi:hypothetical protein